MCLARYPPKNTLKYSPYPRLSPPLPPPRPRVRLDPRSPHFSPFIIVMLPPPHPRPPTIPGLFQFPPPLEHDLIPFHHPQPHPLSHHPQIPPAPSSSSSPSTSPSAGLARPDHNLTFASQISSYAFPQHGDHYSQQARTYLRLLSAPNRSQPTQSLDGVLPASPHRLQPRLSLAPLPRRRPTQRRLRAHLHSRRHTGRPSTYRLTGSW